jgi:cell wall-associated NlpC family hydrolase
MSLEVADASFFKLANIQIRGRDGSGAQAWFIRMNADGTLTIKNERSGKPAEAVSAANGANVRQNKTSAKDFQKWIPEECGNGWYKLRSASGNFYMSAADAAASGMSNVVTAAGGAAGAETPGAMKWRFVATKVKDAGPPMPVAAKDALIAEAKKHLGKKYVFGASGPKTFDCSGFIYYVMNNSGIREMSRVTAQDIYEQCVKIPQSKAAPGDLIFFTKTYNAGRPVTHLGIYLGSGKMIHAGSPVQISSVNSKYYKAHFYAYARIA